MTGQQNADSVVCPLCDLPITNGQLVSGQLSVATHVQCPRPVVRDRDGQSVLTRECPICHGPCQERDNTNRNRADRARWYQEFGGHNAL